MGHNGLVSYYYYHYEKGIEEDDNDGNICFFINGDSSDGDNDASRIDLNKVVDINDLQFVDLILTFETKEVELELELESELEKTEEKGDDVHICNRLYLC